VVGDQQAAHRAAGTDFIQPQAEDADKLARPAVLERAPRRQAGPGEYRRDGGRAPGEMQADARQAEGGA
jgi:hypothetical protein